MAEPAPGKIDRVFSKALERRTRGRPGLYMHSRYPNPGWENGVTAGPYSVFHGFNDLFQDFDAWLSRRLGTTVHANLFAPRRARFAGGADTYAGGLSASAKLRDYNPEAFLTNLIWNTRGERQGFQLGPGDHIEHVEWDIAKDPNAQISVISGAWAVPLFGSNADFGDIRREAARLQRIESRHLDVLRSQWVRARVHIWTMAEVLEAPMEPLQTILDEIGREAPQTLAEAPRMADLTGFGQFLQNLRNQGMHPYLMGDFPVEQPPRTPPRDRRKPYLVRPE